MIYLTEAVFKNSCQTLIFLPSSWAHRIDLRLCWLPWCLLYREGTAGGGREVLLFMRRPSGKLPRTHALALDVLKLTNRQTTNKKQKPKLPAHTRPENRVRLSPCNGLRCVLLSSPRWLCRGPWPRPPEARVRGRWQGLLRGPFPPPGTAPSRCFSPCAPAVGESTHGRRHRRGRGRPQALPGASGATAAALWDWKIKSKSRKEITCSLKMKRRKFVLNDDVATRA